MIWIYVLYKHHRMILDEIPAPSIMEADKEMDKRLGEKVDKRNDIGRYPMHIFPKQYREDLLVNVCSH